MPPAKRERLPSTAGATACHYARLSRETPVNIDYQNILTLNKNRRIEHSLIGLHRSILPPANRLRHFMTVMKRHQYRQNATTQLRMLLNNVA